MSERQPHINLPETEASIFDRRDLSVEQVGFGENESKIVAAQRIRPDPLRPGEFIIEEILPPSQQEIEGSYYNNYESSKIWSGTFFIASITSFFLGYTPIGWGALIVAFSLGFLSDFLKSRAKKNVEALRRINSRKKNGWL